MKTLMISKRRLLSGLGLVALLASFLVPATALAAPPPAGTDPNYPTSVQIAADQVVSETGHLAPGQEAWYSIQVYDMTGRYAEERSGNGGPDRAAAVSRPRLDLTLFVTGGSNDGVRNVTMDLFQPNYVQHWSHGHVFANGLPDTQQEALEHAAPFGTGSVVTRSGPDSIFSSSRQVDPRVGQMTWSGNVDNGQPVLILVRNQNPFPVDFKMFTGDMADVAF
jgi:hypothetical protein